jgi:hypothetical protein
MRTVDLNYSTFIMHHFQETLYESLLEASCEPEGSCVEPIVIGNLRLVDSCHYDQIPNAKSQTHCLAYFAERGSQSHMYVQGKVLNDKGK